MVPLVLFDKLSGLLSTLGWCFVLQDDACDFGAALGKGRNGAVQLLHAHFLPGAVIKTGSLKAIEHEAAVLNDVHHPNVVAAYGTVFGPQGSQEVYLAMERLGPSMLDRVRDFA